MALIFKQYKERMIKDGHELKLPPERASKPIPDEEDKDVVTLTRWLKQTRTKKKRVACAIDNQG